MAGPIDPDGLTDSQLPPVFVVAVEFNVTAVGEFTVTNCEFRFVDPAGDVNEIVPGLIVSEPPLPPEPTVRVTLRVCVVPPLMANSTCPVYVPAASPLGFAYTT